MPIDMTNVATTKSIIRNGKMTRSPISKPRRNSEIINAGTRTFRDMTPDSSFVMSLLVNSEKSLRSLSRTCVNINSLKGSVILSAAWDSEIWPSSRGLPPSLQAFSIVGDITKNVMNKARMTKIKVDGVL